MNAKITREQLALGLKDWRADGTPTAMSDVYLPTSHIRALHTDTMIVRGMRGAGKSFWVEALTNDAIRQELAAKYSDLGLSLVKTCSSIQWDQRRPKSLPSKAAIDGWINNDGIAPSTFWGALILGQCQLPEGLGFPDGQEFDPWSERIKWAHANQERMYQGLTWIDKDLVKSGVEHLVLIDGLDLVASGFGESRRLLRGLFEVMLELRRNKGLRIKAFVREDMTTREVSDFSDSSKLLNEACDLNWSADDLYHLVFEYVATRNVGFKAWRDSLQNQAVLFSTSANGALVKNGSTNSRMVLEALCGEYLRSDHKNRVYTWLFDHLSDGRGRVSPRTMFSAVVEAVADTSQRFSDYDLYAIHPQAVHSGVRKASAFRKTELEEDYPWVQLALDPLKKKSVPIEWIKLPDFWRNINYRTFDAILDKAKTADWFLPWDPDETKTIRREAQLKAVLVEIGVLKLRSGEIEKIDLPDIYRLAYDIGRKGGIRRRV